MGGTGVPPVVSGVPPETVERSIPTFDSSALKQGCFEIAGFRNAPGHGLLSLLSLLSLLKAVEAC
jgi:hypothetical protein